MSFLMPGAAKPMPQTLPANDREVHNRGGGYVYALDEWMRLERFLTIGSQGGTYYAGQRELTRENASVVASLLERDAAAVVERIVAVSQNARAAKQDYGIYALALAAAAADPSARSEAYAAVPLVCRTASTLFQFVAYLKGRRGWSRGLRGAIAAWYNQRDVPQLAYQMVKYRNRYGFSHRDLLRLAHVDPASAGAGVERATLYRWAVGKNPAAEGAPPIVGAMLAALGQRDSNDASVVAEFARKLPREALPTEWLERPEVWEALLYGEDGRGMPLTALLRNLGNLSKCGLLAAGSGAARYAAGMLADAERLARSRIHPIALFLAAKTYARGSGVRGSGNWAPASAILDALDAAFYASFANVEPSGKEMLVAVDASGSMSSPVLGYPNVSAREVSLAFALVVMRTESRARLIGFTDGSNTTEFCVGGDEKLRDFERRFNECVEGRGTDCAIPFTWASARKIAPEAVLIWTDSETWACKVHPDQALAALRRETRKRVKVAIAATTSTAHSVGDPRDANVLQVCGFDASVPAVIAGFFS